MNLRDRLNQVRAGNLARAQKAPFSGKEWGQKFEIERKVLDKFLTLAKEAHPYEFGGLLKIEKIKEGHFRVTDIALFKQRCGRVTFELDEMEMAIWRAKMHKAGEDMSLWSGIIHSHPTLSVEPSFPDLDQLVRYCRVQPAWSVICGIHKFVEDGFEVVKVHYARTYENSTGQERVAILKNIPVQRCGRRATKAQLSELKLEEWANFDKTASYPSYNWKPARGVTKAPTKANANTEQARQIIQNTRNRPEIQLVPPSGAHAGPRGADVYQWCP